MEQQDRVELEAASFRSLVAYLQEHPEVQNIDLMNLAGFCRNCMSKWYLAAAKEQHLDLNEDEAKEAIYGMPYGEWKKRYQQKASAEQLAAFEARQAAQDN